MGSSAALLRVPIGTNVAGVHLITLVDTVITQLHNAAIEVHIAVDQTRLNRLDRHSSAFASAALLASSLRRWSRAALVGMIHRQCGHSSLILSLSQAVCAICAYMRQANIREPRTASSGKVQKPATALLLQVVCVLSSFQLGTPAEEPSPPPSAETVEETDSDDPGEARAPE